MDFSIRLTEDERILAESYAKLHSLSLSEAFKRALFEKIENEHDVMVGQEAYDEYVANQEKSRPADELWEGMWHMNYRAETTTRFDDEFKKLDRHTQKMIKART